MTSDILQFPLQRLVGESIRLHNHAISAIVSGYRAITGVADEATETVRTDVGWPSLGSRAIARPHGKAADAGDTGTTCVVRQISGSRVSLLFEQPLRAGSQFLIAIPDCERVTVAKVVGCQANGSGGFFYAVEMQWINGFTPNCKKVSRPSDDDVVGAICG